jgi:hypothetical protein
MYRLTGLILAILGVVLIVGGLVPSGLLGRLHGVGGFNSGHRTADLLVLVGAVALVVGLTLRVPSRPS